MLDCGFSAIMTGAFLAHIKNAEIVQIKHFRFRKTTLSSAFVIRLRFARRVT